MADDPDPRIESGSVVFGSDCPGVFLRGDDALYYAVHLITVLQHAESSGLDLSSVHVVRGLLQTLMQADMKDTSVQRQQLRPARDCVASHPTLPGPPPDLQLEFEGE